MRGTMGKLSDTDLQQDVIAELDWEPSVDAADVGVTVDDGVVTLRGTVRTYYEKLTTVRTVKGVAGVRAVVDDLEVKVPGAHRRDDGSIAKAAADALEWNVSVPEDRIDVTVKDGRVTLEGEVDWHYQRRVAEEAVESLAGVRSIDNRITIKARPQVKDIKQKITAALHRSAQVDAERIQVEAHGDKVVLRGTVRTWAEKEDAAKAARSAPGVRKVENDISVAWT